MKSEVKCLREFAGLPEDKRPTYLTKVGGKTTTNAATFPLLVPAGSVLTAKGATLLGLLSKREDSTDDQDAYELELSDDITMMETVYDYIDLVAAGNPAIIALAGVKGTSVNTSSIGAPSIPAGLVYEFSKTKNVGEMILSRGTDKLAVGSLTVTFSNPAVSAVKSGDTQMKVTVPASTENTVLFVDVVTVANLLIENQVKASEIHSVMALFNANGLSPVASPAPIVVPR